MKKALIILFLFGLLSSYATVTPFTGLDLSNLEANQGLKMLGLNPSDMIGITMIDKAGDFNGDGVQDIVFGSYVAGNLDGIAYVIFGTRTPSPIDLANLNPSQGF